MIDNALIGFPNRVQNRSGIYNSFVRVCLDFLFALQMAKIHPNFVTKTLL